MNYLLKKIKQYVKHNEYIFMGFKRKYSWNKYKYSIVETTNRDEKPRQSQLKRDNMQLAFFLDTFVVLPSWMDITSNG